MSIYTNLHVIEKSVKSAHPRKINMNDVSLRDDEICVRNPVVLSALSLVGCKQRFVSLNIKYINLRSSAVD